MALDYYQIKFPNSMIVFDITVVYILVAFVAVLTNNLLIETLSFTCRINIGTFIKCKSKWSLMMPRDDFNFGVSILLLLLLLSLLGYGMTMLTLMYVSIVEVYWEGMFATNTSYCLNLIAVSITAWGATSMYSYISRTGRLNGRF